MNRSEEWAGIRVEWKGILALLLLDAPFVIVVVAGMVGLHVLTELVK